MPLTLIDTDILIDVSKNVEVAVSCLRQIEKTGGAAISIITEMELIVGCRNKAELRDLEQFLQRFQVVGLSDEISEIATDLLKKYRLSHGLLIPDGLIAATAMASGNPLISKNQKDYRFIDGLNLLGYGAG